MTTWRWVNEPAAWARDWDLLSVRAEAGTDLWRTTHYGFIRGSGHVYGVDVARGVTASVTVDADYAAQYDQAGLAVWIDDRTWLKAGIEFVDGRRRVSCVVTREFSDWSVSTPPQADTEAGLTLRVRRSGDAVHVHWRAAGLGAPTSGDDGGYESDGWRLLRLAYLPPDRPALVGVYCAAPDGPGFEARFRGLSVLRPA